MAVGYDIELQSAAAEPLSGTVITRTVSGVLLTPRARVRSNLSRARGEQLQHMLSSHAVRRPKQGQ
jgi:hypothetical protein